MQVSNMENNHKRSDMWMTGALEREKPKQRYKANIKL